MDSFVDKVKRDWKSILMMIWIIGITAFLVHMNTQLLQVKQLNNTIRSDIGSIESIVISSDASVAEIAKTLKGVESNVVYIVRKVKRR